jgi:hypothetical protein
MQRRCHACERLDEHANAAGFDVCSNCGRLLVWPTVATDPVASASALQLRGQVREPALRYLVMPWTLKRLLGEPRPSRSILTRICWAIDVDERHSSPTTCAGCAGSGQCTCATCGGDGRAPCAECGGAGEVPGKRKMKKCPSCRGQGHRKCQDCNKGTLACSSCAGTGRGPARVDVVSRREYRVNVDAPGDLSRWHSPLAEAADFDAITARPSAGVELLADCGWLAVPTSYPPGSAPPLRANERVVGARVQQLRPRILTVPLRTRWHASELSFIGTSRQLINPDLDPLRRRVLLATVTAVVVLVIGLVMSGHYLARSPWFAEHGNAGELTLLAVVVGVCTWLAMLALSLPRSNAKLDRLGWQLPVFGLGLALVLGVWRWNAAAPSLVVAEQAFADGELDRAEFELDALVTVDGSTTELAVLREQITAERGNQEDADRTRRFETAATLELAAAVLRERWQDPARRAPSLTLHLARARAALAPAWDARDLAVLRSVVAAVDGLDEALTAEAHSLEQLTAVRQMLAQVQLALASEVFASLERREPTVAQYDQVRAEMIAALDAVIDEQHEIVDDRHHELVERIAALDRLIQFVDDRHRVTDDWPEGMSPAETAGRRAALAEQLAVEQQRKLETERRKAAASARRSSKSSSNSSSSSSDSDEVAESIDCCRYCDAGKPCGDSCIARNKTCRKPRGCAC